MAYQHEVLASPLELRLSSGVHNGASATKYFILPTGAITTTLDFSVLFKSNADLLGADLYIEFWCVKNIYSHIAGLNGNTDSYVRALESTNDSKHTFQFGINSYTHWKKGAEGIPQVPKDTCFTSSGLFQFNDHDVTIPANLSINWKIENKLTVKFSRNAFFFLLNDQEIVIENNNTPLKTPDFFWAEGFDGLVISLGIINFGKTEYSCVLNGCGKYDRGVYAVSVPCIPVALKRGFNAGLYEWMAEYNKVMSLMELIYNEFRLEKGLDKEFYFRIRLLFEGYTVPPYDIFPPVPGSELEARLHSKLEEACYGGLIDLGTAVLMGAMFLPPLGHPLWTGDPNPAQTKNNLEARRSYINNDLRRLRDPNAFVLERLLNLGRYDIAIQYDFIMPHILINAMGSDFDRIVSPTEKIWIPDPRQTGNVDSVYTFTQIFVIND